MRRNRKIMGLGARLCLLAGLIAGVIAYNHYPFLQRLTGIAGSVILPIIGASIGYLIGRLGDPPKRDPKDLLEETFK